MNITDEQLNDRDTWEQKLMLGQCSLADALMMILHIGAPASPYLVQRLEQAFMAYNDGKCRDGDCDDLALAFGCAESRREQQKQNHETTRSNVKFHVNSFAEQGWPILNPGDHPDTESAFTKTADLLQNVSPSTAFAIRYDRDIKKRKRRS